MKTSTNYISNYTSVEWWRNISEQQASTLASKHYNTNWVNLDASQVAVIFSKEHSK